MDMKKLRDLFLTVLGIWLMMAPRVLHFPTAYTEAIWNTWLLGAVLILMIAVRRYLIDTRSPWEDLTEALLGAWFMISPWILGFTAYAPARFNSLVAGGLIIISALRAAFVDAGENRRWARERVLQEPLHR